MIYQDQWLHFLYCLHILIYDQLLSALSSFPPLFWLSLFSSPFSLSLFLHFHIFNSLISSSLFTSPSLSFLSIFSCLVFWMFSSLLSQSHFMWPDYCSRSLFLYQFSLSLFWPQGLSYKTIYFIINIWPQYSGTFPLKLLSIHIGDKFLLILCIYYVHMPLDFWCLYFPFILW